MLFLFVAIIVYCYVKRRHRHSHSPEFVNRDSGKGYEPLQLELAKKDRSKAKKRKRCKYCIVGFSKGKFFTNSFILEISSSKLLINLQVLLINCDNKNFSLEKPIINTLFS